ncbi:helix-turn-helix domain-containing protein [Agrococcus sp. KRD186]|uniref:helix-turn-helix domain-containing protein n=1 Tax=Agrococcus sp. KRD186 TaxID=2729730 RepID=UPI0019CF5869|nr:XRE family transcriptional regulator [Agrococcus sp. KRD186]
MRETTEATANSSADDPDELVDRKLLGSTIQALRKQQGLTMVQLAKGAGVSQPYISEIEAGKAMPSLYVLYALAQQLGSTPVNLLRRTSDSVGVNVVASTEGTRYPIRTSNNGGHFRAILTIGSISVTEFNATEEDDIEGDFSHEGIEMVYVAEGSLQITVADEQPVLLHEGDVMTYAGELPHSWKVVGSRQVRVLQVVDSPHFPQFTHPMGSNRDVEPE